jgi:hypothetical protein
MVKGEFVAELRELINRHSVENGSNTPDYMLADYLVKCLDTWEHFTILRERWYGAQLAPGRVEFPAKFVDGGRLQPRKIDLDE